MEFLPELGPSSERFPTQFKTLELLKCDFKAANETTVKHQIKYRNRVAKMELEQMQMRLKQVCEVIEDLNPSLVQQVCKALQNRKPPQGMQIDYKEIAKSKKAGPPSTISGGSKRSRGAAPSMSAASKK